MTTRGRSKSHSDRALRLIALFKFVKAIFLIATAIGVFRMMRPNVADAVQDWADALRFPFEQRLAQKAIEWFSGLSPGRVRALGLGALLYASVFLVEGIGLWLEKRWAEYLTVIVTASLVPFEIWEFSRRVTPLRGLTIVFNVAVVIYLIYRLRHDKPRRA